MKTSRNLFDELAPQHLDSEREASLTVAANEGEATAQFMLGLLYERQPHESANLVEAFKWFLIAMQNGMSLASDKCFELEDRLTREEWHEACAAARKFRPVGEPGRCYSGSVTKY